MERKRERQLIRIMGIWQILDGVLTIGIYGFYQQQIFSGMVESNLAQLNAIDALFGNVFLFVCTFGTLLIGLGLANLVISHRYVKDNQVNIKIGVYLLVQGLFSYLILDIISLALGMTAGIILLARNKGIKLNVQKS
ncbi:hypothetical protein [Candidatus Enterococcus courvalinii]|uniref:DUF4064 domain-containing protein n=1 Tax=Candidatus Enterococcus courvalinii TaxID=2815329 RepID=A0ABS3HXP9_9ENTE|nr:hypothetical protein [Enterococcus sp. MSG2901]MBO0481191.1 hypothetical protein [Enterococcus sp. MSG2901]